MLNYRLIAGVALPVAALTFAAVGLRSCGRYEIKKSNLVSRSRATGIYGNQVEYTRLRDGSEEVLIKDGQLQSRLRLYQNLDGDNTVDRIRTERFRTRDALILENILVRGLDLSEHRVEFAEADKILLQERAKYSK